MPAGAPIRGVHHRLCAAALFSALSAAALAQSAVEQARTAAGQAAIERAQGAGLHAGIERGLKTPLEIIWLRTAAEADMWRDPTLGAAVEACVKAGAPKAGCAVVGRTAFRYVFGATTALAAPNDVARLLISTLKMPDTPLSAGRLNLAGTGRLYLVTPEMPAGMRPTHGAVILAAGSTLQVADAISPAIQIELTAPEGEPLLLGNLAAADVGRILALLVKPGVARAVEAALDERGQVALRSGGNVQLAALLPSERLDTPATPRLAAARPAVPALETLPPMASLAPGVPVNEVRGGGAPARARALAMEPSIHVSAVAANPARPGERLLVAALAPVQASAPGRSASSHGPRAPNVVVQDVLQIAAVGLETLERPESAFAVATLAPASTAVVISPAASTTLSRPSQVVATPLSIAGMEAPRPQPSFQLAALAPAAAAARADVGAAPQPAVAPVAVSTAAPRAAATVATSLSQPELARMRAEVEAEVAREQQRLAQQALQPRVIGAPPARRFVLGV